MVVKILIITGTLNNKYRVPLYESIINEYGSQNVSFIWLRDKEDNIFDKSPKIFKHSYFVGHNNFFIRIFKLIKLLVSLKYDFVISVPTVYLEVWFVWFIVKKLRKKKIILWDEEFEWKKSFKRKLSLPITAHINRMSDFILVPSSQHKEWQLKLGVPEEKIIWFPNVTNLDVRKTDKQKLASIAKKYNLGNRKVIMFVGRLVPVKGIEYLIDGYYKLLIKNPELIKESLLMIVGDGPLRKSLELQAKKIKDIGGEVVFTGFVKNEELVNYYPLAYVGVIPSINVNGVADAHPLVANEFMIFGKPFIATNMVGSSYSLLSAHPKLKQLIVKEKSAEDIKEKLKLMLCLSDTEYSMLKKIIKKVISKYNSYNLCLKTLSKIIKAN